MSSIITFQQDTYLASEIVAIEYFPSDEEDKSVEIELTIRGRERGDFSYRFDEDDSDYPQAQSLYIRLVEDWKRAIQ